MDGVALEKLGDFETHCLYTGCRAWHLGHLCWKVHDAPLGHLSFLVWKGMQKPVGRLVPSGVLTVLDDMGVVGDCLKVVRKDCFLLYCKWRSCLTVANEQGLTPLCRRQWRSKLTQSYPSFWMFVISFLYVRRESVSFLRVDIE